MDSELKYIENFSSEENQVYFFAGILKAHTDLDIETIFKFISSIYSNDISQDTIQKIEIFLLEGKLGKAKELLDSNNCNICNKLEGEKIKIACGHIFHINCLLKDVIDKVETIKKYLCTVCNQHIPNIEEYHIKIKNEVKNYKIANYYQQNQNKFPCPKCDSPCEVKKTRHAYCSLCSITFCCMCLKILDYCKCVR